MSNKPNKNTSTSKKKSKNTFVDKKLIVLSIILGIFVLIFVGLKLKEGYEQRQTMKDLDSASKELRAVYDELVIVNGNDVDSYDWNKVCVEASSKYGKGLVSCGVEGEVLVGSDIGLSQAATLIGKSLVSSSFSQSQDVGESPGGLRVSLNSRWKDTVCALSYFKNELEDRWSYKMSCKKQVPNFLPGYKIIN